MKKISLNCEKSYFMLFKTRNRHTNISVKIGDKKAKFLGVKSDENSS